MRNPIIGARVPRVDAADKVTGRARYTADLCPADALVAKVLHSTIPNGRVRSMDISRALAVPGVERIVTCFDVPEILFPTAGHPWSVEPAHQDVADRKLLNTRVRYIGDDIAAVVARDELAAGEALKKIWVDYEEFPPMLDWDQATADAAQPLHPEVFPTNVLAETTYRQGSMARAVSEPDLIYLEKFYATPMVQHCHLESVTSFAYAEGGKLVVVCSTQIPHIVRRVVGQALGIPWGQVRVIKPYVGGGFGNKQEVLYEPLNAYLCQVLGGRCVRLELSREEVFACTRVRHAMDFHIRAWVRPDGTLSGRDVSIRATQGAYASHGHAVTANTAANFRQTYQDANALTVHAATAYTNLAAAGAMRGYGIPQSTFAMECLMDDISYKLGMDPVELRRKNCMPVGFQDPVNGITCHSSGLIQCLEKGAQTIGWTEKRSRYANQTGPLRRGVGMALFSYKTGVYPISLETSSARMLLNQDGSVQVQLGATEIGQGGDTVFLQMASAATGIPFDRFHIVTTQDTDVAPFDTGAYASRQTYVTGMAIKKTGEELRRRILHYGSEILNCPAGLLFFDGTLLKDLRPDGASLTLTELAHHAFYDREHSRPLTAECTHHCTDNTFSFGCTFVEIEVDLPLGKVRVVEVVNVHDSGVLINPALAEAQVHGGQAMGIGYGLSEQLRYDATGRLCNGNLLDYKLPTALDLPDLQARFVQEPDPSGPFGNKSLGEPPLIPVAPAIRNALLHATGVAVDSLPLDPQKLVALFQKKGLL